MTSTLEKTPLSHSILKILSLSALLGLTVVASFPASAGKASKATYKPTTAVEGLTVVGTNGLAPDTAPLAIDAPEVRYPFSAAERDQEGWVIVEMDIDEKGRPYNTAIVRADADRVFHRSSLRALKKFRFVPATLDGQAVAVTGKRYKISYSFQDS